MANPNRTQAIIFANLIAELEPEVRRAFMASVTDLQANVNWILLLDALSQYNTDAAVDALNISAAAWNEYSQTVTDAYARSGAAAASNIVDLGYGNIGIRFDMRNPIAEQWIMDNVANTVTMFTNEQIEVARDVITNGYSNGDGPRTIATDLVGRVENGTRQGGVLGLDRPRAERLEKVSRLMRTPDGVKKLVTEHNDGTLSVNYKVNKSTEKRILAAYKAGREVPESQRVISERQYKNALLKARGDTVANTETANAVMGGRETEWRQFIEEQNIDPQSVIKTWHHRRGATREFRWTHILMNGKSVRGIDTPFQLADGSVMLHAHDEAGGARNNINCACDTSYRIDHSEGL